MTTREVDELGRVRGETGADGRVTWTVYKDPQHEVRVYAGWENGAPTGPTLMFRADRARGYTEQVAFTRQPWLDSWGRPTGQEPVGQMQSFERDYVNAAGQVVASDVEPEPLAVHYATEARIRAASVQV